MFLARPSPLPCESLSSWRQRAGLANGFLLFPRLDGRRGRFDPDRTPIDDELRWLEDECCVPRAVIVATSLESIASTILPGFSGCTRARWVVPASDRKAVQYGPGCCPQCLVEDEMPYFRLAWRFAFLTSCPVHGCSLIDSCPDCGKGLWPSNLKALAPRAWKGFLHCYWCGGRILSGAPSSRPADHHSARLWRCAFEGAVPDEVPQARSPSEVFSGLWALGQLLLRVRSEKVWGVLPMAGIAPNFETENGSKVDELELLPVSERARVLSAAYWMMQDWPQRFLSVAAAADIQRTSFTGTHAMHPPWLSDAIARSLTKRRRDVTPESVRTVMATIVAAGKHVSKIAVKRALGVTEARAVDMLVPTQRRFATRAELLTLFGKFERLLKTTPDSRDQRATLLRDYLIFLVSVLSGLTIERVCHLREHEVLETLEDAPSVAGTDLALRQLILRRCSEIHELYASVARPRLLGDAEDEGYWFLSRSADDLAGHTVRERITKLMGSGFEEGLWKSADVFLSIFHQRNKGLPEPRAALDLSGD